MSVVAQPSIGTTTFSTGSNSTLAAFDPHPRSGTSLGWDFFINGTGNGSMNLNGMSSPSTLNMFGNAVSTINISSDDGSEFDLEDYVAQFFVFSGSYTITSYRNGAMVGSTTGNATNTFDTFDFSSNADFDNIDEIRLTGFGGSNVTLNIDDITIGPATVLPVELSAFEAKQRGEQIVLTWLTSSELNNEGFAIESSRDGVSFAEISRVPGLGTSQEAHSYQFIHTQPAAGNNYYRLRQIDFDGKFTYSSIVVARFQQPGKLLGACYPQPSATGYLQVPIFSEGAEMIKLELLSPEGKVVYQRQVPINATQELSLDLSALATGVYLLKVQAASRWDIQQIVLL